MRNTSAFLFVHLYQICMYQPLEKNRCVHNRVINSLGILESIEHTLTWGGQGVDSENTVGWLLHLPYVNRKPALRLYCP